MSAGEWAAKVAAGEVAGAEPPAGVGPAPPDDEQLVTIANAPSTTATPARREGIPAMDPPVSTPSHERRSPAPRGRTLVSRLGVVPSCRRVCRHGGRRLDGPGGAPRLPDRARAGPGFVRRGLRSDPDP